MTGPTPVVEVDKPDEAGSSRLRKSVFALMAAGLVIVTLGHVERVQDVDPQYVSLIVDRAEAFGGTFYENGIYGKGPLEPAVHWIGSLMTTDAGYWFAIAGAVALISLLIALTGARTASSVGAGPAAAVSVGVAAFVAFTFSDAQFAGVLWVRNLTISLLAGAWLILLWDGAWVTSRRRTLAVIAMSALVGLSAQTLLTSALSGATLLIGAILLLRERAPEWERIKLLGIGFIAFDAAFLSAPIWYWARGAWEEFWAGWWVHANYMSSGTQRSLPSQLWLGVRKIYEYHREHPLVLVVLLAFAVAVVSQWKRWSRPMRIVAATAAAWWLAGWIELALSQRYTHHYYSIVAVPILVMAALLVGWTATAMRKRSIRTPDGVGLVIVTAILAIYVAGPQHLVNATRRTIEFRGPAARVAELDRNQGGEPRSVRAVLDLVSDPGDPLLGWARDPWPYPSLDRVSATRFPWRSFLIGEIYLGSTSPLYVLPQTWEWFAEDVAEADPVALIEERDQIDPTTPFATLADARFTEIMSRQVIDLWLRNDVLAGLTEPAVDPWHHPRADTASGVVDPASEPTPIGGTCRRFDATFESVDGATTFLVMRFVPDDPEQETLFMRIEPTVVLSYAEEVLYLTSDLEPSPTRQISLVVGRRAAAMFVDGQVVAALRLPGPVEVDLEVATGPVIVRDAATGPASSTIDC